MKTHLCLMISATLAANLFLLSGCTPNNADSTQNSLNSTPSAATSPTQTEIPTQPTQPSVTDPPETSAPTVPAESSVPTVPTEGSAPTLPTEGPAPTEPDKTGEYIGLIYTRDQLEAMDNTLILYGPGRTSGGVRPGGAVSAQKEHGKYSTYFIAQDAKVSYLTFDCGYEYNDLTSDILDTLKEKNVKAVFFVTLSYCKNNPQLVQRMLDEGHIIGNHSCNHISLPTLTVDQMVSEIMDLHAYVKEHFGYEMHLFRPPSGEYSVRSLAVAESLGYITVEWSFAYADWITDDQPDPDDAYELITGSAHNGAIYLLHAVSSTNAQILEDVIDSLRSQGYSLEQFKGNPIMK